MTSIFRTVFSQQYKCGKEEKEAEYTTVLFHYELLLDLTTECFSIITFAEIYINISSWGANIKFLQKVKGQEKNSKT